jgi:hypothetical protein
MNYFTINIHKLSAIPKNLKSRPKTDSGLWGVTENELSESLSAQAVWERSLKIERVS